MPYNLNVKARQAYQYRSMITLLRMGHCAPTVMRTVLDITRNEQAWPVRLAAGLPGGIGNTEGECGGLTAPLIILGLRHGLNDMRDELPVLFDHGHAYCQRFFDENETLLCKDIQSGSGQCIHAICHAAGLLAETQAADNGCAIPGEQREACSRLYGHLAEKRFHCAQAVFEHLQDALPVTQELLDASAAFLGGTLFMGMTCSAFTAGVMAIGLKTGEIENSYFRVIRMLVGGMDILDEGANKFHRTINTGHRLSEWFCAEFGSTQCRSITRCDFSCMAGVEQYIASDSVTTCREIAKRVAEQVHNIIEETAPEAAAQ